MGSSKRRGVWTGTRPAGLGPGFGHAGSEPCAVKDAHQARRSHSPLHARKEAEKALSLLSDSQDLFCQPRNGNEVEFLPDTVGAFGCP